MSKSETVLVAVGGGELAEARSVLDKFLGFLKDKPEASITVMTIATSEPGSAGRKYNSLFRKNGVRHVNIIDVSQRDDAFDKKSLKKIEKADALYFTGGDQLNVTSLLGGSPLHDLIHEKVEDGFIIAGTSAGAMMMSSSTIIGGQNDIAPQVGGVEIAPGLDLVSGTLIDTHFAQRGRYGRLLTAIAHYPQDLGIGIDERTAIVISDHEFEVTGEGAVTIMDASRMDHSNLPYCRENEPLGMFDIVVHVLPHGYRYNIKTREPISPPLKKMAGENSGQ